MNRYVSIGAVFALSVGLGACASKAGKAGKDPQASAGTATSTSTPVITPAPTPTTTRTATTTATTAQRRPTKSAAVAGRTSRRLPIITSRALSSHDQDPTILNPISCTVSGGVLTAKGTFKYQVEETIRYGDVVELYAYGARTAIDQNGNHQVAELGSEHPFPIAGQAPWTVTVPVDPQLEAPAECLVAVQSTHAFMGGGDAGG